MRKQWKMRNGAESYRCSDDSARYRSAHLHSHEDVLTSDAYLAALAIEYGAELYSSDTDFRRFPRVNWINPLA
jgi:predicted nucleic acid-binding protein